MTSGRFGSRHVALAGLLACVGLAACTQVDAQKRTVCEALIPLIEPADAMITINRVVADETTGARITILYRSDLAATRERARLTEVHHVVCQFIDQGLGDQRLQLQSVETSAGGLGETPIVFLNARWMRDAEAMATAQRLLHREGQARVEGFVTLDAASGYFVQTIVNAGPPTALYVLLALAYSLVYGLTNRINLAFGQIATIGAFGALIGVLGAASLHVPQVSLILPLAVLVAFALAGGSGAVIGRTVFLPLMGRSSQPMLVATIGLALAISEFLARSEGVRERWLQPILADPHRLADGPFEVVVTTMQLLVIVGTAILVGAVIAALRVSSFGRLWRAVADDRTMARMLGIDVDRVIVGSFALGSGLAGIGGAILTLHYGGTSFALGTTIGLKALVAAIVGGIGSLPGAAIGGLALGLTESFWSAYEPIAMKDAFVYVALTAFLILRPQGLLGTRRALEERDERP